MNRQEQVSLSGKSLKLQSEQMFISNKTRVNYINKVMVLAHSRVPGYGNQLCQVFSIFIFLCMTMLLAINLKIFMAELWVMYATQLRRGEHLC